VYDALNFPHKMILNNILMKLCLLFVLVGWAQSAKVSQGTQTDLSAGDVGWAGDVLQQLSPRVSEMCTKLLNSRVEPLVQGALAALNLGSKAFKFTRINLGHVQPKITNIRTHGAVSDMNRIVLDFDMIYDGNADIQVAILGTASGLKNVKIAGRARIVLSPTMNQLPLVGGIQLFFLTKPEIDFDFDGLAKIADLPVIKKKIKEDLLKDLNEQAVFPNRVTIPLSWTANPQMIWQPQISGILGVKLKSVKGLPRRGGMRKLIGQDRPDVYGIVSVGSKEWNTNVVKNSQAATWNEWYEFPLEVVDGHLVEINMYDDDTGSNDEFLGYAALDVHSAMQTPHFLSTQKKIGAANILQSNQPLISRSTKAKLEMVHGRKTKYANISGEIDLEMAWMPLVNVPGAPTGKLFPSSTDAVLSIFVYSANNLVKFTSGPMPAGHLPSPRAIIKVANYTSITETAKKTQQATFNHGEVYMLQSNWKTQTLVIKVEESDSGKSFGSISIPLTSLQGKDLVQELKPLNPAQPSITITVSASIRFPYAK